MRKASSTNGYQVVYHDGGWLVRGPGVHSWHLSLEYAMAELAMLRRQPRG